MIRHENVKKNDKDLSMDEWADLIDDAKKREAINDLSVIAYRMLQVIVWTNHKINEANEILKKKRW